MLINDVMNIYKTRYVLRTIGGILFATFLTFLLFNFGTAEIFFFSTLTSITNSAFQCLDYIFSILPYEIAVLLRITVWIFGLLLGVALLSSLFLGAGLFGLAQAGAPVSVNRMLADLLHLFKKDKSYNSDDENNKLDHK